MQKAILLGGSTLLACYSNLAHRVNTSICTLHILISSILRTKFLYDVSRSGYTPVKRSIARPHRVHSNVVKVVIFS